MGITLLNKTTFTRKKMGTARQSLPTPELETFSDRLQEAVKFKKIDISVLAKETEYKPDDIHKLLAGMREPGFKKLILLANALGCSVDYLLGLIPEPQRASIVIEADTDALNQQPGGRGQTSGQISGKKEQFIAMVPELMESDTELLTYLAGFLIERKEKRFTKLMEAVTARHPKEKRSDDIPQILHSRKDSDLDDNNFDEEDDLWDDIEDDGEDEEFEDNNFEEGFEDEDEDDDFEEDFDDD
jgi:transcriptional regulator with XRE-family HTH domain